MEWSETITDPDWLEDDLDAALEWKREDDLTCGGCGNPLDISTDDDLRTAWAVERVTCWSCHAKERTGKTGFGQKLIVKNRADV